MKNKFWSSDKIIGLTALFVSLLTLFIFIKQTNIIEKQSHLSVMPYIMMETANNGEKRTYSISLVNHGVGPAFIEKTFFHYKGKTSSMQLYDFLKQEFPIMDSINVRNVTTVDDGQAIPSGGSLNIITVGNDERSYKLFLEVMQILNSDKFNFEIHYKSIYDDRWKIDDLSTIPVEL